jgi:hypothetical protein
MFETPVSDRPEVDVEHGDTSCERRCAPREARPRQIHHDDIARFNRDPLAFAEWAGAPTPEVFVKAYLEGLERRMTGVLGAPRADRHRLATLTAQSLPLGDLPAAVPREGAGELDVSPRMGPVVVACAVVQAAATVVAAAAAVYTAVTSRRSN